MTLLAGIALAAVLLGPFLPVLTRWGGVLIVVNSLLSLTLGLGHGTVISLIWLIIGTALWLAGHWLEAYRTGGYYRSWLACKAFGLPGMRTIAPVAREH